MQSQLAADGAASRSGQFPQTETTNSNGDRIAIYGVLAMFAVLLAAVTYKHEIYQDEAQAWLIARDSKGLLDLFHNLRYEAHPALWYLFLYLPAHNHSSMAWMQYINYGLALAMAWLVLSCRSLPIVIRVLVVFGVSVFFSMGVVARSYMLAGVLLTAAARCLLGRPQRHWLAMVLLALAINTHFFAIPVVLSLFVWVYWLTPSGNWTSAAAKLRERRFWHSLGLLSVALLAFYFTVRPEPDRYTTYQIAGANNLDYLVLGVGRVWHYFLPLTEFSAIQGSASARAALIDACITVLLWLTALSVLPTRLSRWFMITVSFLWTVAVAITVHIPLQTHCTILIVSYGIALMINSPGDNQRPWLPAYVSEPVLLVVLSIQVSICLSYCMGDWQNVFSGGKSTAQWLDSAAISVRPLVIQPDTAAPTILGYTGIRSAYLPNCFCQGSFISYRRDRETQRQVTAKELEMLRRKFGLTPVVVSRWPLSGGDLKRLGLRLVYTSPHGWAWDNENLLVYDAANEVQIPAPGVKQ